MSRAGQVFALVALLSAISVSAIDVLPLLTTLPATCGRVRIVEAGDSCESIAALARIDLDKFKGLNPLVMCGIVPLVVGGPVCTGDAMAFCNNPVVAGPADTCESLQGTVVGLLPGETCATLATTTTPVPVCVASTPNQCAVGTMCGKTITPAMQELLATVPDYCSIIKSCEGTLKTGTFADKPSLVLTLTSATASVAAVVGNDGHPELTSFAAAAAGTSQLEITFTPGFYADGSNYITFADGPPSRRRKMLATSASRYGMRSPCTRCY